MIFKFDRLYSGGSVTVVVNADMTGQTPPIVTEIHVTSGGGTGEKPNADEIEALVGTALADAAVLVDHWRGSAVSATVPPADPPSRGVDFAPHTRRVRPGVRTTRGVGRGGNSSGDGGLARGGGPGGGNPRSGPGTPDPGSAG